MSAPLGRLDTIESAIAAIKDGRPVVVIDDEDRENEGDLIFAAELATPELVAFSAAKMRSPSFSRFSSSTTTTGRPAAISLTASSMVAKSVMTAPRGGQLLDVLGDHIDLQVHH